MSRHMKLLLARANNAVHALGEKGCDVLSVHVEGRIPVIEVDHTADLPTMIAIRSRGGVAHVRQVSEWMGCHIESPTRRRAPA